MQIVQDQRYTSLELAGILDINTTEEVHKALLAHFERHDRISLDLSQIESCDAAGVQLLLAAQRSGEASGKSFGVVGATDTFTAVCAALGIPSEQLIAAPGTLPEPAGMGVESSNA